jgi:hypothetical protein
MASSTHDIAPIETGLQIQTWPFDRLVFHARNPRKNDAAVDRTVPRLTQKSVYSQGVFPAN